MSTFERSSDDYERRDVPSFIEARPPLITGPGQRPRPYHATNLMDLYESESLLEDDFVKVYLRIKPCAEPNTQYEVRTDKVLMTSAEGDFSRRTHCNVMKQHTFSHIFRSDATQKQIFTHVVKENLKKLVEGHSYTLLTYGASGSGKTYTLMGTEKDPGLIPRSLEYMFLLVTPAQRPMHRPRDGTYETLAPTQQAHELELVNRLRKAIPVAARADRLKYRRMSQRLTSEFHSVSNLAEKTTHYIWVSFIEIYNEAVYDLLQRPDHKRCANKNAVKLKICEDANGNAYVKGATQAFVRTGAEAYDVMWAGRQNLHMAATGVHAHSSRSHCIFTITLLSERSDGVVSTYVRLCDLAGSERAHRTQNAGVRMTESRAINSSLHVLERCLHTLRKKQRATNNTDISSINMMVPYRESKLTRLLGAPLSGASQEAVSMVVTVNPSPMYAQETRHVLQLAAVASDIYVNPLPAESASMETSGDSTDRDVELVTLRAENDRLQFEMNRLYARLESMGREVQCTREQSAATMRELVEQAKEASKHYYTQQAALQQAKHEREKERLREELNERINALIVENTKLKEKLEQRPLEKAMVESEVEHLLTCLAERDQAEAQECTDQRLNSVHSLIISDDSDSSTDDDSDSDDNDSNVVLETIMEEDSNIDSARSTMDKDNVSDNSANERSSDVQIVSNDVTREDMLTGNSVQNIDSDHDDEVDIKKEKLIQSQFDNDNSAVIIMPSTHSMKNSPKIEDSQTQNSLNCEKNKKNLRCESLDKNDSFLEAEDQINRKMKLNKNSIEEDEGFVNEQDISNKLNSSSPSHKYHCNIENFMHIDKKNNDCSINLLNNDNAPSVAVFSAKEHEESVEQKIDNVIKRSLLTEAEIPPTLSVNKTIEDILIPAKTQNSFTLDSISLTNIGNNTNMEKIEPNQKSLFNNPVEILLTEHKIAAKNAGSECDDQLDVSTFIRKSLGDTQDFMAQFTIIAAEESVKVTPINQPSSDNINGNGELLINCDGGGMPSVCRPKSTTSFKEKRDSIRFDCRKTFTVEESATKHSNSFLDLAPQQHKNDDYTFEENFHVESSNCSVNDKILPFAESAAVIETLTNQTSSLNLCNEHEINIGDNVTSYDIYTRPEPKFSLSKDFRTIIGDFNFHSKPDEQTTKTTHASSKPNEQTSKTTHALTKLDDQMPKNTYASSEQIQQDKTTNKNKSLRLRKKIGASEDKNDQDGECDLSRSRCRKGAYKLRELVNLQHEFSDVTLEVQSVKKHVPCIGSPEKTADGENVPPATAKTCPAKSTRSRNKLYTPRAELLDDSAASDDDGNLRGRVQRPSYHRGTRAKRKL